MVIDKRWILLLIAILFLGMGVGILYFFNPYENHFYPVCIFNKVTGLYCPGCGLTRALYNFIHGDIILALRNNVLFVVIIPITGYLLTFEIINKLKIKVEEKILKKRAVLYTLILTVAVFTVLRNINLLPFTLLAPIK